MKVLKLTLNVSMIAFLAFSLSACGKKKNGSTAAAPAATEQCIQNAQGAWVSSTTGAACTPTTASQLCPTTGINPANGQSCIPGTFIQPGYPYPTNPNNSVVYGCSNYYYQYGIQYVPVILRGQYVCVRIDLLTSSSGYNDSYYEDYGYDYFYEYPPYEDDYGTPVNFGGSWGTIKIRLRF